MFRILFAMSIGVLAARGTAEETPSTETDDTVVIEKTEGEWQDAQQPELPRVVARIIERTNDFRKEQKKEPLAKSAKLTSAAQDFADYMAKSGRYGHAADGQTPAERVQESGYVFCIIRENIAYAFRSNGYAADELAEQFFGGWKESPGHRRNMLAHWVVETGVAIAKGADTDTYFAVQLFGRPESKSVTFEIANRADVAVEFRFDDRKASLEPRIVRQITTCNPVEILFMPLADKESTTEEAGSLHRFNVKGGERLIVEPAESGYRVRTEQPSKPDAEAERLVQ